MPTIIYGDGRTVEYVATPPKTCRCTSPAWDFNDDGRGFCRTCHGYESRRSAAVSWPDEHDDILDRQAITNFPECEQ